MNEYRLIMKGQGDYRRALLYTPYTSELKWEDTGKPLDLSQIGFFYEDKEWGKLHAISPEDPGKKSPNIKTLKIQLGLKCNYACQYCSQAHQPKDLQGNLNDARKFVANLGKWFDGGPEKDGTGVRLEFWGGEPLVYWKQLRYLATVIKSSYPNIYINMVTNGSLLTDEMIDFLDQMEFGVAISHDGPGYAKARGEDPLDDPQKLLMIKKLYNRLMPIGKFSFNCVLTKDTMSYVEIADYIATKMGVPVGEINLSSEENLVPYGDGGMALSPKTEEEHRRFLETVYWEAVRGQTINMQAIKQKCEEFFHSVVFKRPGHAVGQKCGMDDPHTIAVDLLGNVTTCQNMSADTYHKIGHIEEFDKIALNTSWHWTKREECVKCPVVQLCKGSCMFNKGETWKQGCDNAFTYNLAVLGIALYYATRLVLERVEGETLRRPNLPNSMEVIRI